LGLDRVSISSGLYCQYWLNLRVSLAKDLAITCKIQAKLHHLGYGIDETNSKNVGEGGKPTVGESVNYATIMIVDVR
jgi:hypothetical protein